MLNRKASKLQSEVQKSVIAVVNQTHTRMRKRPTNTQSTLKAGEEDDP